jgi:hypothetical protein
VEPPRWGPLGKQGLHLFIYEMVVLALRGGVEQCPGRERGGEEVNRGRKPVTASMAKGEQLRTSLQNGAKSLRRPPTLPTAGGGGWPKGGKREVSWVWDTEPGTASLNSPNGAALNRGTSVDAEADGL